jgi:hypothetical protein
MTARFPTIASIARDIDEFLADQRWARVRVVAAAIPADVDLDDEDAVIRSLLASRLRSTDFLDVFDSAVDLARERRAMP